MFQAVTSFSTAQAAIQGTAAFAHMFGTAGALEAAFVPPEPVTPSHAFEGDMRTNARRFVEHASMYMSPSSLSGDGPASAGGAEAPPPDGAGSGDGPDRPAPGITAYDVFYALLSITMRHEVRFGEELVVYLLHEKGWVEEVSDEKWKIMNDIADGREDLERELELVKRAIRKKGSAQHRLKVRVEFLLEDVTSMFSRGDPWGSVGRKQLRKSMTDVGDLRKKEKELEDGIAQAKVMREWLGHRVGLSEYGYVFLTDAGLKVLERLKASIDDQKMALMTVDEYLSEAVEVS